MFKFMNLNCQVYMFFIFLVFLSKVLVFYLVKSDAITITLGGGSDSDYYHDYVLGYISEDAVNSWPVILSWLNDYGLYSRDLMSCFLLILNLFFIPCVMVKNASLKFIDNQEIYLILVFLSLIYPTLYFYTFDIYRDVFMVFSFLLGCYFVKKWIDAKSILYFCLSFPILIAFGVFLVTLRPYLGYAFLLSLFLFNIKLTRKRVVVFSLGSLFVLFLMNYFGLLNLLIDYRSGFVDGESGSTLGLDFSNPDMFLPNFILSMLGQLFGLYITNPIAIFLFIVETLPFVYMLYYIIKNISYVNMNKFLRFLLAFFVVYSTVWLIGNDNLGTAVRLRIYNYLVIYICFFSILAQKQEMFRKL